MESSLEFPYEGYMGRVKVISAHQARYLGEGQIVGREDPLGLGRDTVKILLDSEEIIYGCECWWVPVEDKG